MLINLISQKCFFINNDISGLTPYIKVTHFIQIERLKYEFEQIK